MSEQQHRLPSGGQSLSRQKFASALQAIRKNAVYRSIVARLQGRTAAADLPAKKRDECPAKTGPDDGGFGDWRAEGLPEHSHRRPPPPPCAVFRSASDHCVQVGTATSARRCSSSRQPHAGDAKRVEEAYRRGFWDGSAADAILARHLQQHRPTSQSRRRPNSMQDFATAPRWRLSSSSTVPAGLGSKSRAASRGGRSNTAVLQPQPILPGSLPASASRLQQRQRRLSLPVPGSLQRPSSQDAESPSATVPTRAAAIALHQLIECYRNGYRVTDHKIALMLDILDTQQRLAQVKRIAIPSYPSAKSQNHI